MANKTGPVHATSGQLTDVDTTLRNMLGATVKDDAGNEYIYLAGAASVVAGTCVTYSTAFVASRSVTGAGGPVAFAMAAILAANWGWFQIAGSVTADYAGAATAGAALYSASTGKVDDAVVTGDLIVGATVGATVSGSGAGSVNCRYPWMSAGKLG